MRFSGQKVHPTSASDLCDVNSGFFTDLAEVNEVFQVLDEIGPPEDMRKSAKLTESTIFLMFMHICILMLFSDQAENLTFLTPPIKSGHVLRPNANIIKPKKKWWYASYLE